MQEIQKKIQDYFLITPELSQNSDNTNNIIDLETGSIRLSISSQLNINVRTDNQFNQILQESSKNSTTNLIPRDIFYSDELNPILEKKYQQLSNITYNNSFQTSDLKKNIQNLQNDLFMPNIQIVNNRTINSKFNILTGEFINQKEDIINPRFKDYRVEDLDERNDPHLLSKKKTKKSQNQQQETNMDKLFSDLQLLGSSIEVHPQFPLSKLTHDQFKKSQESIAKILSMTNELISSGQFEFTQKKVDLPKNTLWDALYGSIKKTEKKEEIIKELPEQQLKLQNLLDNLSSDEEDKPTVIDENNQNQKFGVVKLGELKQQTKSALYSGIFNYAIQDTTDLSNFYYYLPLENFAIKFPFELDDFQKAAILHLENKESVFVAAHTSAGKTVVAEYAIALSQKHKTRAIYTSPIKALSNQKYREFHKKFKDVGIITGDVTIKPDASCVIMTTEILRSMLYKGSDMVRDIEWVIFDEVHYVSNSERGVVWEETIIMLPEHIGIIMLSATVPNAMDFADWVFFVNQVGRTKKRKIYVQMTQKRPVPLEHTIYVLSQFHKIKESDGPFLYNEYQFFLNNIEKMKEMEKMEISDLKKLLKKEKQEKDTWKARGQKRKQLVTNMMTKKAGKFIQNVSYDDFSDKKHSNEYLGIQKLIKHCQKEKMLPCTIFCFSKAKILQLAQRCMTYDLCDKNETGKITVFFNKALKRLKPNDRELPQFIQLRSFLEKGYAIHHGDLLPLAKEIVEILYSEGLVKVLFATETFAMGVNMPAKTVIYFGLQKNDGIEFRFLKSSEYTQMSGRAGRRGLDEKGNVIVYLKDATKLPQTVELRNIIDQKGETLESKFRLTYAIILNLLTAKDIDVIEMMKRSFGENTKFSQLPRIKERIKQLKKTHDSLQKINCPYEQEFEAPMESYYRSVENISNLSYQIYTDPSFLHSVKFPKFALIQCVEDQLELGVVLQNFKQKLEIGGQNFNLEQIMFRALLLAKIESKKKILIRYEKENQKSEPIRQLNTDSTMGYRLVILKPSEINEIFSEQIKLNTNTDNIQNDHRLLQQVADELKFRLENPKKKLQKFQLKGGEISEMFQNKEIQSQLNSKCHGCEMKLEHFSQIENRRNLHQEMKDLLKNTNEENLSLLDDFQARQIIIQKLNYIDSDKVPLIKARVARELSDNEIYLCEILMENVLDPLEPNEIAAVLSGFICQYKTRNDCDNYINVNEKIQNAMSHIEEILEKIAYLEIEQCIFLDDVDSFIQQKVNFNHCKVVYEWANQLDFVEVCQLTESQEGTIVKTIQRLDILLRDVKNAVKVMGNMTLCKKIDEASTLIKRDIVFVTSLYLE